MLTPKSSPRGQLLSQYVCGRITTMEDIDIGLFDYDRHNAIYYFILNADEQIYLRYGGRDSRSADSYLDLRSLELALKQGLVLHDQFIQGRLPKQDRPPPRFPRDIPLLLNQTIKRHNCVECHLIDDYQTQQLEQTGALDKLAHMFRSPDLKTLGIDLDVPRGLVVKAVRDAAQSAGLRAGDVIVALNDRNVWTFADLQYHYDKVPRDAEQISLRIQRSGREIDLDVILPERWWRTDLAFRHWSIDPLVYFKARPLSPEQKRQQQLRADGFASRVTYVDPAVRLLKRHELQVGDIVFAVDGVEEDDLADNCILHIKLRKTAGDTVMLGVLRDGEKLRLPLKTERQSFRK